MPIESQPVYIQVLENGIPRNKQIGFFISETGGVNDSYMLWRNSLGGVTKFSSEEAMLKSIQDAVTGISYPSKLNSLIKSDGNGGMVVSVVFETDGKLGVGIEEPDESIHTNGAIKSDALTSDQLLSSSGGLIESSGYTPNDIGLLQSHDVYPAAIKDNDNQLSIAQVVEIINNGGICRINTKQTGSYYQFLSKSTQVAIIDSTGALFNGLSSSDKLIYTDVTGRLIASGLSESDVLTESSGIISDIQDDVTELKEHDLFPNATKNVNGGIDIDQYCRIYHSNGMVIEDSFGGVIRALIDSVGEFRISSTNDLFRFFGDGIARFKSLEAVGDRLTYTDTNGQFKVSTIAPVDVLKTGDDITVGDITADSITANSVTANNITADVEGDNIVDYYPITGSKTTKKLKTILVEMPDFTSSNPPSIPYTSSRDITSIIPVADVSKIQSVTIKGNDGSGNYYNLVGSSDLYANVYWHVINNTSLIITAAIDPSQPSSPLPPLLGVSAEIIYEI